MLIRLIIFKVVFFVLVVVSAIGPAIRDGADPAPRSKGAFRRYPLPLGCGCAAVALFVSCGDLLLVGRRKGALPTYTDEEFLAKFGGSANGPRNAQ